MPKVSHYETMGKTLNLEIAHRGYPIIRLEKPCYIGISNYARGLLINCLTLINERNARCKNGSMITGLITKKKRNKK